MAEFTYEGGPFREPPLPMPKEDGIMVMKQMKEQEKYGVVKEVTEDKHNLEYVSNTFLKKEKERKGCELCQDERWHEACRFPITEHRGHDCQVRWRRSLHAMDANAAYNQIPCCEYIWYSLWWMRKARDMHCQLGKVDMHCQLGKG